MRDAADDGWRTRHETRACTRRLELVTGIVILPQRQTRLRLDRAGINPLPVQRPTPVWMGGMAEPVLKRVAQISDGWFPQFQPGDEDAILNMKPALDGA